MNSSPESFRHAQSAHCESGVISNLFQNQGVPLTEAMAFGIGSGIFFLHMPFVKVMGLPLTSYRSFPGSIFKKACKRLGIPFEYHKYGDALKGSRALDDFLNAKQVVGAQSNIYWLPYMPEKFRFQFNAHNIVVFGKDQDDYLVSDPVLEAPSRCPSRAMTKARFAKGVLAPKGLLYYPVLAGREASSLPWEKAIHDGIQETVRRMLYTPLPFCGVRGIRLLGRHMKNWPVKIKDPENQKLNVANVVRMQEEIGTGGAGFRFLYAAFLQEAGTRLEKPVLIEASRKMTEAGNLWRDFASVAVKFCKGRETSLDQACLLLAQIADREKEIYVDLGRRYL